jgi:thiamine biosynthesis protein ThiS
MEKMTITINQVKKEISKPCFLAEVLNHQNLPNTFAIAVNGKFVPKRLYDQYSLTHQDVIAILTPMQGG